MPSFVRNILLWLLHKLEAQLDPELKAELAKYDQARSALEAQIAEEQKAIAALDAQLAQIKSQRAEIQTNLAAEERDISRTEDERSKILNEGTQQTAIANASDNDVLRSSF
jgi:septal ring factor EnvC (AmiA/AmiB activator)